MATLNARATAANIIATIFSDHHTLSHLLEKKSTSPRTADEGFIQELCYGVMRWYEPLNAILKKLLRQPLKAQEVEIHALLLIGLYQLIYLKTPAHAAIYETVEAARQLKKMWAVNLVNGLLRQFLRQQNELLNTIQSIPAAKYAHPAWMIKAVKKAWPTQWETILHANNERAPLTLRVNQLKNNRADYLNELSTCKLSAHIAENTQHGIMLDEAQSVVNLPGFKTGVVSVQDGSAQLAAELLLLEKNQRVLDACAAPGGKTLHLLETEPQLQTLIALDVDPHRVERIEENWRRCKSEKSIAPTLMTGDATQPKTWWDDQPFDRILIDAPCSATGVIRRHPDIKFLRQPEDINDLNKLQLSLLNALWPLLKPGGILLYVTCSIFPSENADVIRTFLTTHADAQEKIIEATWGIETQPGRQLLPGEKGGDGFFYARLEKITLVAESVEP